ncbi:14331_t:CDS:1, partial [Dentiscutata heterogama]
LRHLVVALRRRIQSLGRDLEECRENAVEQMQGRWLLEQQYARLVGERNRLRASVANYEEELRRLQEEQGGDNDGDRFIGY